MLISLLSFLLSKSLLCRRIFLSPSSTSSLNLSRDLYLFCDFLFFPARPFFPFLLSSSHFRSDLPQNVFLVIISFSSLSSHLLSHRPPFSTSSVLFSSVLIFFPFSLTRSLTPSRRPSLPHLFEPSRLYFFISPSLPASLNLPSILNFSISLSLTFLRHLPLASPLSSFPTPLDLSLFLLLSIPQCHLPLSCISAFALHRLLSLSILLSNFLLSLSLPISLLTARLSPPSRVLSLSSYALSPSSPFSGYRPLSTPLFPLSLSLRFIFFHQTLFSRSNFLPSVNILSFLLLSLSIPLFPRYFSLFILPKKALSLVLCSLHFSLPSPSFL